MTGPDIESRQASFLRSGILNAGAPVSSLPRTASVGDTILYSPRSNVIWVMVATAVDSVGSGVTWSRTDIPDYSLLPPVRLCSWQSADPNKWSMTKDGAPEDFIPGTEVIVNIQSALPPRSGYSRQYRWACLYVHYAVGNTTTVFNGRLYRRLMGTSTAQTDTGLVLLHALNGAPASALGVWCPDTGWVSNAVLDGLPDGSSLHMLGWKDWSNSSPNFVIRSSVLEGRYV